MIEIKVADLEAFNASKEQKDDYLIVESVLLDLLKSEAHSTKPISWRRLTYDLTKELADLQDGELRTEQIFYIGAIVDKTRCLYRSKIGLD